MTDITPLPPPREPTDLDRVDREIKRRLSETTSWDRAGPPQKSEPYLRGDANQGTMRAISPDVVARGQTVGTGYDHLEDLGRMSAEAVMKQCEATIASVEDMGKTVHTLVKRLGESLVECDKDLKHVSETAAAIREKAKHTEAVIDHVNDLSKSIRVACAEFQKKVAL